LGLKAPLFDNAKVDTLAVAAMEKVRSALDGNNQFKWTKIDEIRDSSSEFSVEFDKVKNAIPSKELAT